MLQDSLRPMGDSGTLPPRLPAQLLTPGWQAAADLVGSMAGRDVPRPCTRHKLTTLCAGQCPILCRPCSSRRTTTDKQSAGAQGTGGFGLARSCHGAQGVAP